MPIRAVGGAVADMPVGRNTSVHGVQVFANFMAAGNSKLSPLKGSAKLDENLLLEVRGEGAQFQLCVRAARIRGGPEFLGKEIAQPDTGAGVVQADAVCALDVTGEAKELFRSGHAGENEDLAGPEFIRNFLEHPANGEVLLAAEVDADEELAGAGGEVVRGAGFGGVGRLTLIDQFVREQNGALIEELAFEFLGPRFQVENTLPERADIDIEAGGFRFVNRERMLVEDGGSGGPQFVEEVSLAVGRADNAEFFQTATQRVAHARKDRFPDGFGVVVERELGEDDIGGIAANGSWFGGQGGDARVVLEENFRGALAADR